MTRLFVGAIVDDNPFKALQDTEEAEEEIYGWDFTGDAARTCNNGAPDLFFDKE